MKKLSKLCLIISIIIFSIIIIGCNNKNCKIGMILPTGNLQKTDSIYVTKIDTIFTIKLDTVYILNNIQNDSIKTELDVAKFKLERIRYYNEIAGKNNNIKYLRGWINRVLNN